MAAHIEAIAKNVVTWRSKIAWFEKENKGPCYVPAEFYCSQATVLLAEIDNLRAVEERLDKVDHAASFLLEHLDDLEKSMGTEDGEEIVLGLRFLLGSAGYGPDYLDTSETHVFKAEDYE